MSKANRKEPLPVNFSQHAITYSFEYYDLSHKYCLSHWEKSDIQHALKRLGEINKKSYDEMTKQAKVMHFHEVEWEKTSEKNGFPVIGKDSAFQFALLGINNKRARVFGKYYEGVFYIVWFDLNHEIWPVSL